jgi:hypothetical protein
LKSLAETHNFWLKPSRVTSTRDALEFTGRDALDFTGESGAAVDPAIGEKVLRNRRFLSQVRLPDHDSSWGKRLSTQFGSTKARERIVPGLR